MNTHTNTSANTNATLQPSRLHYLRRKFIDRLAFVLAWLAAALGVILPCWILITVVSHGMGAFNSDLLTKMTPPPNSAGGLLNAITGSLILVGVGTLIATPIGIIAGIFLAEFGRVSKLAMVVRFVNDILLSAPSIVIGLFVYMVLVLPFHHFSAWAGAVALAIVALPVIVRTTESMLLLVPDNMREAAYALGATKQKTITTVTLLAARNGIVTGILLSIARISGETAPLLFTALNNQFGSRDLSQPIANLPVVIFQFAMSPYESWQALAWAGAALITLAVVIVNLSTRYLFSTR